MVTAADRASIEQDLGVVLAAHAGGSAWCFIGGESELLRPGERMFVLPAFLLSVDAPADADDVMQGLSLTGHFLERRVYGADTSGPPAARAPLNGRATAARAPAFTPALGIGAVFRWRRAMSLLPVASHIGGHR